MFFFGGEEEGERENDFRNMIFDNIVQIFYLDYFLRNSGRQIRRFWWPLNKTSTWKMTEESDVNTHIYHTLR